MNMKNDKTKRLLEYIPTILISCLCFVIVLSVSSMKTTATIQEEVKVVDEKDMLQIMQEVEEKYGEEIYNSIVLDEGLVEEAKKQLPEKLYFVRTEAGNTLLETECVPNTKEEIFGAEYDILECREATETDIDEYVRFVLTYDEYTREIMSKTQSIYAEEVYK